MFNFSNPFIAPFIQMQVEASRQYAGAIFSSIETMSRIGLAMAQRAANEQLSLAQSVAQARAFQPKAARSDSPQGMLFSPLDYQKEALRLMSAMQSELTKSITRSVEQGAAALSSSASAPAATTGRHLEDMVRNPLENLAAIWGYRDMVKAAEAGAAQSGAVNTDGGKKTIGEKRLSHVADRRIAKARDRRVASNRAHH